MFFLLQILIHILSFLRLDDLMNIRLVSQNLYQLSLMHVRNKARLHMRQFNIEKLVNISYHEYKHITITGQNFTKPVDKVVNTLLNNLFQNIESVIFNLCTFTDNLVLDFVLIMPKLRSLNFHGSTYVTPKSISSEFKLPKYDKLQLDENVVSKINDIKMIYCSFMKAFFGSPIVVMFFKIVEKSLKRFEIDFEQLSPDEWEWFEQFNFNLEYFHVQIPEDIDPEMLIKFIHKITGQSPKYIPMSELKRLKIEVESDDDIDDNIGVIDFQKLTHLEVNIKSNFLIQSKLNDFLSILQEVSLLLGLGIAVDEIIFNDNLNSKFHTIKLRHNFSDKVIYSIATSLPNLKCLSLERNDSNFPREYLRKIFHNLIKLEDLTIKCDESSNNDIESNADVTIANLQKLKNATFIGLTDCPEISLKFLSQIKTLEDVGYRDCNLEVSKVETQRIQCFISTTTSFLYKIFQILH